MHEDLAIIMAGGGMRSAYAVGVMLALAEEYDVWEPGILIAGSGSAGTAAYYLAGQYASIRNIWTELLASKRFINPWRFWKVLDIDYLIDVVFRELDPLDLEQVERSKTRCFIPVFDMRKNDVTYFRNDGEQDYFEVLRATKSVPVVFRMRPGVSLQGSEYCDSPISSRVEAHISVAVEHGAKRIILIRPAAPERDGWNLGRIMFFIWMFFRGCASEYLRDWRVSSRTPVPDDVEYFTLYPKESLRIGMLDNRREALRAAVEQGYRETVKNGELRKFLKSSV